MPINLKEIFVSDSNQIKIDKINYNFDQIIGTGGQRGPQGPQGVQGQIGEAGPTGAQGAQGAPGETGLQGNDGVDRWYSVQHDPITTETNAQYDTYILKPKIDDDYAGQNNVQPTCIYLGDPNFNNQVSPELEGDSSARATLVVAKTDPIENNIRFISSTGTHDMVIRGDFDQQYGSTVFHIQKGDVSDSLKVKGEISFNDVKINATDQNAASGNIVFSSNKTEVRSPLNGFNTVIGTKSFFNDRVCVIDSDLLVLGTGFTRLSKGTTVERDSIDPNDLSGGNIRYNSTTRQYEAYYENTSAGSKWLNLREVKDADGDTYISLPISNDNDKIEFVSKNDTYLRIGGEQFSLTASSAGQNTVKTIQISENVFADKRIHFRTNRTGISFKEGPAFQSASNGAAVNYESSITRRTLDDFFYRPTDKFEIEEGTYAYGADMLIDGVEWPGGAPDSAVLTNAFFRYYDSTASGNIDGGDGVSGLQLNIGDQGLQLAAGASAAAGPTDPDPLGRLLTLVHTEASEITYQKVGNLVTVVGNLTWRPFTFDSNTEGNNYPNGWPGTYFSQTLGQDPDDNPDIDAHKYWNDLDIQDSEFYISIPEIFNRLPNTSNVVRFPITLGNSSIDPDLSGQVRDLVAELRGPGALNNINRSGNIFFNIRTPKNDLTQNDPTVKVGHLMGDNGQYQAYISNDGWIYTMFNFSYFCEDKKSYEINEPFNEASVGGGGGGAVNDIRG